MELKDWLNSINFSKEDLSEHIKDYNNEKASQALKILSNEQLDYIKQKLDTGGKR